MTGPCLVAFTYSAKSAATSFCVAIFTVPLPLHRPKAGFLLSHRSPGSGPRVFLHRFHKVRGSSFLVQNGFPRLPRTGQVDEAACDCAFPLPVRIAIALQSLHER